MVLTWWLRPPPRPTGHIASLLSKKLSALSFVGCFRRRLFRSIRSPEFVAGIICTKRSTVATSVAPSKRPGLKSGSPATACVTVLPRRLHSPPRHFVADASHPAKTPPTPRRCCNPSTGSRHRYSNFTGSVGTRGHLNDTDLSARRTEPQSGGSHEPARWPGETVDGKKERPETLSRCVIPNTDVLNRPSQLLPPNSQLPTPNSQLLMP